MTNIATAAKQRYGPHSDYLLNFIKGYECDEYVPPTAELRQMYGKRKYLCMLQEIANRRRTVLEVSLADLGQWGEEGDDLMSAVLRNTERYCRIIQTSIYDSGMIPDRSEPYRDDETLAMRECDYFRTKINGVNQHLETTLQTDPSKLPQHGSSRVMHRLPDEARHPFSVVLLPSAKHPTLPLRAIGAPHVGSYVTLDCVVMRVGPVRPMMTLAAYQCSSCSYAMFQVVRTEAFTPVYHCPTNQCRTNRSEGTEVPHYRLSTFALYQEVRVQEISTEVPTGCVPKALTVVLCRGDMAGRACQPGDGVSLSGVYLPHDRSVMMFGGRQSRNSDESMYLLAHSVVKHKKGYGGSGSSGASAQGDMSQEMLALRQRVKVESRDPYVYDRLSKSIGAEIYGHDDVKKALLLMLVGAPETSRPDGMKIRGNMHVLLMGDPGVAKSQLLKQLVKVAPRAVYTTGKGSSGAGLTASVVRDSNTAEVFLEGGALVMADNGVCAIDEFDKMEEGDRTAIHEVMEQQTVSIAKAGIVTTLNARTSVLAAANPVGGRYNPHKVRGEGGACVLVYLVRIGEHQLTPCSAVKV